MLSEHASDVRKVDKGISDVGSDERIKWWASYDQEMGVSIES